MSANPLPSFGSLSSSQVRHVEQVCRQFERQLQAGQRPRIEDFLEGVPEATRPYLLRELLALEVPHRQQHGEIPAPKEYWQRFPDMATVIGAILDEVLATGPLPPAPPDDGAEQPARFGRYRVTARLGQGSFGVVYKGRDDELSRDVAIKVPHQDRITSPKDVEAYLAEARTLAGFRNDGIVPVFDVGRGEDGLPYVVSAFIEGTDLKARLEKGRLTQSQAVELTARVAEALHHAHQKDLIHRDVKPANILLDGRGNPVVADFGLALRYEDYGTGPTFAGTPAYMSPEQARREGHRVDARTDVYSLGVVLYELLTGQRPFPATELDELLEQVKTREPRPPRQLDETVPVELDRICLKCLQKRVSDRYSTARDLADDLRHWQRQDAGHASVAVPVSALPPVEQTGRRAARGVPKAHGSLAARGQVCKWLIGINVLAFIVQVLSHVPVGIEGLGPTGPKMDWLTDLFMLDTSAVLRGQVWRLLTYTFVHDPTNLWHIVLNMLFLWWFGRDVEDIYGHREFLTFYLLAGMLGGVVIVATNVLGGTHSLSLGAAGAVTAVMVLCALQFPTRIIRIFFVLPVSIWLFVLFQVSQDVFVFLNPAIKTNTAVMVHLAGGAFAFLYRRIKAV